MNTHDETLRLAAGHPPVSAEDWLDAVDGVLRGAPFEDRLVSRTPGGLAIEPLYNAAHHGVDEAAVGEPGASPWVRGTQPVAAQSAVLPWDIRQRHDLEDPAETNAAILEDLEQGVTSILLRIRRRVTQAEVSQALDGVLLDMATVAVDAGPWATEVAPMLMNVWEANGIAVADRRGALRIDPLGSMARFGASMPEHLVAVGMHLDAPHVTTMAVDATPYADGGASDVLEVACSLATGVEYLRWMTSAGMTVDQAADQIEFTYSASADQFATMAKLRAARRTWGRVIEASGGTAGGQRQHVVTLSSMFTTHAPWVNLLRATTAGFSAAVGGASAITILPFDSALGQPAEVGRRTARNISLLLMEEAHVGKVVDPGGGSWFVEDLTASLANAAWREFQNIEGKGGMHAALVSGRMQERVDEDWAELEQRLGTRKDPLIGVSEFPDLDELPVEREPMPPLGRFDLDPALLPVPDRRRAAAFDEMRDAAGALKERSLGHEADEAKGGSDIFVAAMGSPAVHSARLGFAANFFAVGGLRVGLHPDHVNGFDDPEEVAEAFARSGQTAAVICSSDALYRDLAEETAAALKGAGCYRVYLAGDPGEARPRLQRAGVDDFIHLGTNIVDSLHDMHEYLGLRKSS